MRARLITRCGCQKTVEVAGDPYDWPRIMVPIRRISETNVRLLQAASPTTAEDTTHLYREFRFTSYNGASPEQEPIYEEV